MNNSGSNVLFSTVFKLVQISQLVNTNEAVLNQNINNWYLFQTNIIYKFLFCYIRKLTLIPKRLLKQNKIL